MTAREDDWRLRGQDAYLAAATLVRKRYYAPYSDRWEHDHCEFCSVKFMAAAAERSAEAGGETVLAEGYTTTAEHPKGADYYWICEPCFNDFKDRFEWDVAPG
jgi:hypothetical protein